MIEAYQKNAKGKWARRQGEGIGYIHEVHQKRVTQSLKGIEINATPDNPTYLHEQENVSHILKCHPALAKCN